MRVFCPESWPQVPGVNYSAEISLTEVLPKAGQQTHAFFFSEDLPVTDVTDLLWKPPFTAINGWSDQPSEIARSFLVTARARRASSIQAHLYRYDLEVIACEPLIAQLRALPGEWELETCLNTGTVPPKEFLMWEEVSWCGIADIHGLKYISASTSGEAYMELLVEEMDGEMFGLLSTHLDPGGEYSYLGRRKLSQRERSAVEAAMKQAVQLVDSHMGYLLD